MKVQRREKPWGYELVLACTERYAGKILHVRAGHRLSLQHHVEKDETLFLLSGTAELELHVGPVDCLYQTMPAEESYRIRPGERHRLTARTDTRVLEVSTPELDDVVRWKDDYGRAEPSCERVPSCEPNAPTPERAVDPGRSSRGRRPYRMNRFLFLLAAATAGVALGVAAVGGAFEARISRPRIPEGAAAPRVDDAAPNFTLDDTAGTPFSLRGMRGGYVSLNFFCGCGACRHLARAWHTALRQGSGVKLVGVTAMGPADARHFACSDGVGYTVLLDPYGTVSKRWGSTICPQSWLIDPSGRILYRSSADEPASVTVARVRTLLHQGSGGRS